MSEYRVQPNEAVLLRKERVSQEVGRKTPQVNLMLTKWKLSFSVSKTRAWRVCCYRTVRISASNSPTA